MTSQFKILKPYYRGLPLIILSMVAFYFIAQKYLSYVVPMYESSAKIRLADTNDGVSNTNLFKDLDVFTSTNKIATEINVFKSSALLKKCIDKLPLGTEINRVGKLKTVSLFDDSPIQILFLNCHQEDRDKFFQLEISKNLALKITTNNELLATAEIGDTIKVNRSEFIISLDSAYISNHEQADVSGNYEFRKRSDAALIADIQSQLDVSSVDKEVPIIKVRYKSINPKQAALVVNTLLETYTEDYIEIKFLASSTTVAFLDKQIASINELLTKSENNIQDFREAQGITNLSQESETELRKISQLKIQLTNLKMSLDAIMDLENYINKDTDFLSLAPNFGGFSDVLSTELIKSIKALQAKKRDLLLQYKPNNEKIIIIDQKINDNIVYLKESIKNTRNDLEVKHYSLISDIEKVSGTLLPIPGNEKELKKLGREFDLYQKSYMFLNEKKIEAQISQAAKIAFHRIIAEAEVARKPISPNRTIISIIATILGMMLAIFVIFVIHIAKAKVNDREYIESNALIPLTATSPKLKNEQAITKHFHQKAVEFELKNLVSQSSILSFSSFKKNEGAAFNALHTAKAFAAQGKKTLILDFDNSFNISNKNLSAETQQIENNLDYKNIDFNDFSKTSKQDFTNFLESNSALYDITIVSSEDLKSRYSLMTLAVAETNFIVLDARLTPAKKVLEADLLKEEFKFTNLHFFLNREAFNPNVISEFYGYFKKFFSKHKSKLNIYEAN